MITLLRPTSNYPTLSLTNPCMRIVQTFFPLLTTTLPPPDFSAKDVSNAHISILLPKIHKPSNPSHILQVPYDKKIGYIGENSVAPTRLESVDILIASRDKNKNKSFQPTLLLSSAVFVGLLPFVTYFLSFHLSRFSFLPYWACLRFCWLPSLTNINIKGKPGKVKW